MTQGKTKSLPSGQNTEPKKRGNVANLKPRWQEGVSGNPGGRPKMDPEVKRILEAATPGCAKRLVELAASTDERISLAAIESIFNRVYGRPVQQVDAEVRTTSVQQAHLQILLELQAKHDGKVIEGDPIAEVIDEGQAQIIEEKPKEEP